MFWADKAVEDIEKRYKSKIKNGETLVIRDEKTASGRVHVGSMRGVAVHGIISEILKKKNIQHSFLYEINDFDAFDTVPAYLDTNVFEEHLGKPLFAVPSPDSSAENYAEYFGEQFSSVITKTGFEPTFYYSSTKYREGLYNDVIRTALLNADKIRDIYKKVSGGGREENWLPIMVICEKCGRVATTEARSFDGEKVQYSCSATLRDGTKGCSFEGEISPFDGNAKLPWKVEWAAKFKVFDVVIEGSGKDLSTKGGARDVANHIAKEIFNHEPPYDIPYEFFLVGGKKMSTSKGEGSSAYEIAELLPPHIFRLALLEKNPKQAINFDPEGDTIPKLFDSYDKNAQKYFSEVKDDFARIFELAHFSNERGQIQERFLPRFAQIAFLIQMPHLNLEKEVTAIKGEKLNKEDKSELKERAEYAREWLSRYAPEEFKFELQKAMPSEAKHFSSKQKSALKKVLAYIKSEAKLDGQALHSKLHEIRQETGLEPSSFFGALYLSFLGKERGPKAGWFLSVLDRDFLIKRLNEVVG